MHRIFQTATSIIVITFCLATQAAAQSVKLPLQRIVQVREDFYRSDKRGGARGQILAFGVPAHDVDINSSLYISINTSGWEEAVRDDPRSAALVSPEVAALLALSDQLLEASDLMVEAVRDGSTMAGLARNESRESDEFRDLARAQQDRFSNTFRVLNTHLGLLTESQRPEDVAHAADLREQLNSVLTTRKEGSGRFAVSALLLDEAQWTAARVEEMAAEIVAGSRSLVLVLSAAHHRGGERVELALPGYNDIPEGLPVPYDKLNLVPSAEDVVEMEKLEENAALWADVLNQVRDERLPLEEAVNKLTHDTALDFSAVVEAVDQVLGNLSVFDATDWRLVGVQLNEQLEEALSEAVDDADRVVLGLDGPLGTAIAAYVTSSRRFASDLVTLHAEVTGLRRVFSEANQTHSEVEGLVRFLSVARHGLELADRGRSLITGLADEIGNWAEDGEQFDAAVIELESQIDSLGGDLQDEFNRVLSGAAADHLGALVASLDSLGETVNEFTTNLDQLLGSDDGFLLLAAASDVEPPSSSFDVSLATAPDTRLDIQTLNPRREGDVVELRAWLYRIGPQNDGQSAIREGSAVSTVTQHMKIMRFGWYSAPSVGLTYLSSMTALEGMDTESRSFVPQVSWMFLHRSWPGAGVAGEPTRYVPKWTDAFSFGLHSVVLDFDNDNQLEPGVGLTVGIYRDWVQLGVGINLGLDNEPYYFIGTRLFQVLKGVGIKKQPTGTSF